jgi:hypothetical protein
MSWGEKMPRDAEPRWHWLLHWSYWSGCWRCQAALARAGKLGPLCQFCGALAVDSRRLCVDCALQ